MSKKNKKAEVIKNEQLLHGVIPGLLAVEAVAEVVPQQKDKVKAKRQTAPEQEESDQRLDVADSDENLVINEFMTVDLSEPSDSEISLTQNKSDCKINSKGQEECDEGAVWWKTLLGLGLLGGLAAAGGGGSSSPAAPVVCVDMNVYSEDGLEENSGAYINEVLLRNSVHHVDDIYVVATGSGDESYLLTDDSDVVIELCAHETNLLSINAEGDGSLAMFAGDYQGYLNISGSLEEVIISATGSDATAVGVFLVDGSVGSIDMIIGDDDTYTFDAQALAQIDITGSMTGDLLLESTDYAENYDSDYSVDVGLNLTVDGDMSGNIDLLALGEDTSLGATLSLGSFSGSVINVKADNDNATASLGLVTNDGDVNANIDVLATNIQGDEDAEAFADITFNAADEASSIIFTGDVTAEAAGDSSKAEFNLDVDGEMRGSIVVDASGEFSFAGNPYMSWTYQPLSQGYGHGNHNADGNGVFISGNLTDTNLSDDAGVIELTASGFGSEAYLNVDVNGELVGDVSVLGSGSSADMDLDLVTGAAHRGNLSLDAEASGVSIDMHAELGASDDGVSLSGNFSVNSGVIQDVADTDITVNLILAGDLRGNVTMTSGTANDIDYNDNNVYIEKIDSLGDMVGNITLTAAGSGSEITSLSNWNWGLVEDINGESSQDVAIEFNGLDGDVRFEAAGEDSNISVDLQVYEDDFVGQLDLIAFGDGSVVHSNLRVDDNFIGTIEVQANGQHSTAGTRRGITADSTDAPEAVYEDFTYIENSLNLVEDYIGIPQNNIDDGANDAADNMGFISTQFAENIDYLGGVNSGAEIFGEDSQYGFFQNQGFISLVVHGNQSDTFEINGDLGSDGDTVYQVSSLASYNGFSAFVYKSYEDDGSDHDPEIHRLFIYETSSGAVLDGVETSSGDDEEYFRFEGLANSSKISYVQMFGVPGDGNPSLMSDAQLETFFHKYVNEVMSSNSLSGSLAALGEDSIYQDITNGLELYDPVLNDGDDFENVLNATLELPNAIIVNADGANSDAYYDIRIEDDLVGHVNVTASNTDSFAGINLDVGNSFVGDLIAEANGTSTSVDIDVFVGDPSNLWFSYGEDAHSGNIVVNSGTTPDNWSTYEDEDAEYNFVNLSIQIAGLNQGNVTATAGSYSEIYDYSPGEDTIYIEDLNFGILNGDLNLTAAGTYSEITSDNTISVDSSPVWHPPVQMFEMQGDLNFSALGNYSSVSVDVLVGYDNFNNSGYYPVIGGTFTGDIDLTAAGGSSFVETSLDVAYEINGDITLTASGADSYVWSDMHVGYLNTAYPNNDDEEGDVTGNLSLGASGSNSYINYHLDVAGNLNGNFVASATGVAALGFGEDYYVDHYGWGEYGSATVAQIDAGDLGINGGYLDGDGDIGDVYLNADATTLAGLHLGNLVDIDINADRMGDLFINSENLRGGSVVNVDIDLSLVQMVGPGTADTFESVAGDVYVQGGRLNDVYLRYQDAFSSNVYLDYQDENNAPAKFYGSAVIELAGGDLDLYGANEWWNAINSGSGEQDELNNRFMTIYGFTNGDSFANEMDYIWFSSIRNERVSFTEDEYYDPDDAGSQPTDWYVTGSNFWDLNELNFGGEFSNLADFLLAADIDLDGGLQDDVDLDNQFDTLPANWETYAKFYFGVVEDSVDGIADGYLAVDNNGVGISYLIKFDNFTNFNEQQLLNTYTSVIS